MSNRASRSLLDLRYEGIDDPTWSQGARGNRRISPFSGCTSEQCYGTEGGAGTGTTPLPVQGAAAAMLAHRYGTK